MNLVNAHQQKKNANNICGIRLADFRCCAIKSVKRGLFLLLKEFVIYITLYFGIFVPEFEHAFGHANCRAIVCLIR